MTGNVEHVFDVSGPKKISIMTFQIFTSLSGNMALDDDEHLHPITGRVGSNKKD